jgi:hypothetical protein
MTWSTPQTVLSYPKQEKFNMTITDLLMLDIPNDLRVVSSQYQLRYLHDLQLWQIRRKQFGRPAEYLFECETEAEAVAKLIEYLEIDIPQ